MLSLSAANKLGPLTLNTKSSSIFLASSAFPVVIYSARSAAIEMLSEIGGRSCMLSEIGGNVSQVLYCCSQVDPHSRL